MLPLIISLVATRAQAGMATRAANKANTAAAELAVIRDKMTFESALKSVENLNVERSGVRRQVQSALASMQSQRRVQSGSVAANAAASDSMGSSVLSTLQDVSMKADTAQAMLRQNLTVREEGIDRSIFDVLNQGISNIVGGSLAPAASGRDIATAAGVSMATAAGTYYAKGAQPDSGAPGTPAAVTTGVGTNYSPQYGSSLNTGAAPVSTGYNAGYTFR